MLKAFAKLQANDQLLNQVQDNLVRTLGPVTSAPILDGVLVTGVLLSSGETTVNNPLLRAVRGVIAVNKSSFSDIHTGAQAANPTPTKTITLTASAAVTCDLWVF